MRVEKEGHQDERWWWRRSIISKTGMGWTTRSRDRQRDHNKEKSFKQIEFHPQKSKVCEGMNHKKDDEITSSRKSRDVFSCVDLTKLFFGLKIFSSSFHLLLLTGKLFLSVVSIPSFCSLSLCLPCLDLSRVFSSHLWLIVMSQWCKSTTLNGNLFTKHPFTGMNGWERRYLTRWSNWGKTVRFSPEKIEENRWEERSLTQEKGWFDDEDVITWKL